MDYNIGDIVKVKDTDHQGVVTKIRYGEGVVALFLDDQDSVWTRRDVELVQRAAHVIPTQDDMNSLAEALAWLDDLSEILLSCDGPRDLADLSDDELSQAIGYAGGIHTNLEAIEKSRDARKPT